MKRAFLLMLSLMLFSSCAAKHEEKLSSASSQSNTAIHESTSVESAIDDTPLEAASSTEKPAEDSELPTESDLTDVSYLIRKDMDISEKETGCDRYFALFDNLPEEDRAGLEMPNSTQYIGSYFELIEPLQEYIRTSDRYEIWQEYQDLIYLDGKEYRKGLYETIQFFDIPRETFVDLVTVLPDDEWERQMKENWNPGIFNETMVDLLYSDDTYARNTFFCAKESAFVAKKDGEIYSGFWFLYNTPEEAITTASFTSEELAEFIQLLQTPYTERDQSQRSVDYANYQMADQLRDYIIKWYTKYTELVG